MSAPQGEGVARVLGVDASVTIGDARVLDIA